MIACVLMHVHNVYTGVVFLLFFFFCPACMDIASNPYLGLTYTYTNNSYSLSMLLCLSRQFHGYGYLQLFTSCSSLLEVLLTRFFSRTPRNHSNRIWHNNMQGCSAHISHCKPPNFCNSECLPFPNFDHFVTYCFCNFKLYHLYVQILVHLKM